MLGTLDGPWLLVTALILFGFVAWRLPRPRADELRQIAAITLAAGLTRFAFGLWGPLHVNGQGPLWIHGALEPGILDAYGPGYFELFGWLMHSVAAPDVAIFAANAVLSTLCPAILYATARLVGVGRWGSLVAAATLALDAVTILTAASELYIWPLITLIAAVQLALALFVRAEADADTASSAAALVAAGLLAAAAARIQAAGYLPLALAPLIIIGASQPQSWSAKLILVGAAAAAIGGTVLLTSANIVVGALNASSVTGQTVFAGIGGQHLILFVALLAACALLRRWAQPPWLPLFAVASLALMPVFANSFRRHPFQVLFYLRLCLPGVLLGAAALVPHRIQGAGWALGAAALAAAGLLVPAWPYIGMRTTEQLEYHFLQETLPGMEADCVLTGVTRAGKRVWAMPSYLVPSRRYREIESLSQLRDAAAGERCIVYVRASLCSSSEARSLCEAIEREIALQPIATRTFPAAASDLDLPYDRSEVEVTVFRVGSLRSSP